MLSPVIYLMMNGLFFTLRLSGGGGSFPRPLKAAEEKEYLERCAQGDLEARNILGSTILVFPGCQLNKASHSSKTCSRTIQAFPEPPSSAGHP